ncbi:MAG: hypothetical protein U5L96_11585 [Owenweeksia sp.]|nr:hypothetical protein [Owenweeksia sp.]
MEPSISQNFISDLQRHIEDGRLPERLPELNGMHPADIAEVVERMSVATGKELMYAIDEEIAADALIEVDEEVRAKILEDYTGAEIAQELVDHLDSDDAADLINELPVEKRREVLSSIEDPLQAKGLADLLVYPENTAGALMATELIKVNQNWKVLQCVKEMRRQAEGH